MADGTWTNGVGDQNWADAGNWSGVAAPGDGETATFDGNETDAELPAANQPGAGTIHFVFTGAYDFYSDTKSIEVDILGSAGAAIGDITVNNAGADIVPGANFGSTTCTLTAGHLSIQANRTCTGDIVVVAGNSYGLYINGVTLAVSGGTVEMQANTLMNLDGGAPILDLAEPMRVEGAGDHTINLSGGGGDIYGGIDASSDGTSRQVTVTNAAGAGANIVQAGVTGDLDLGTDGAGGLADWSAVALFIQTGTVTMAADANVYRLTVISGELVGAAKTITADAGGFTFVDGTISGTLDVDLSGAAGAYAQLDGTIAAAAVLNVTAGSGGFTWTALTQTGKVNITVAAVTTTAEWGGGLSTSLDTLTLNAATTQSGTLFTKALAGAGTLTGGASTVTAYIYAVGDWAYTGTTTGGRVTIRVYAADLVMTNALNVGTRNLLVGEYQSRSITFPGITCGPLTVHGLGANLTQTLTINGDSSGTSVTLGTSTNQYGVVTFGAGYVHTWTGAIAYGGTGTANAITFGGRVELGGNVTLAGITPDFGSAYIVGAKALPTLSGASAGTVANTAAVIARMTITNLTGPAANKIVAYSHRGERVHFDNRLPAKARDGLNCKLSTGNSNILSRLVVARQPNFIRASSRRVRRCARGTGRGRISLTRKDTQRN